MSSSLPLSWPQPLERFHTHKESLGLGLGCTPPKLWAFVPLQRLSRPFTASTRSPPWSGSATAYALCPAHHTTSWTGFQALELEGRSYRFRLFA